MILTMICLSFGAPRKYFSFGTNVRWSPRAHSSSLNGPVPIGLELYGTLLMSGYFGQHVRGHDRVGAVALAEQRVDRRRERLLHVKDDRVVVRRVDAADEVVTVCATTTLLRVFMIASPGELRRRGS